MPAPKRRSRRRGPRPRFYFFIMLAVVLAVSARYALGHAPRVSTHAAMAPSGPLEDRASVVDHSAELFAHAAKVQQALEGYAKAHGGLVPATPQAFDRQVVQGGYLGMPSLPDSPWGGHQPAMLPVTPEVRANAGLGAAQVATEVSSASQLGALCYEALGPRRYRLYGIGRGREGQAAVVVQLGTMVP